MVAQAALETGWGKYVIKDSSGSSSNNLFNIKADSRWQGAKVTTQTLEYRDGIANREQANFRRYEVPQRVPRTLLHFYKITRVISQHWRWQRWRDLYHRVTSRRLCH